MAIVSYNPAFKGRFTKLAHVVLICGTFARGVSVAYLVIVSLMIGREGMLNEGQRMVFNQFSLYGLLLGDLSEGVAYTLFFMLPLHTVFGVIGLLGVLCRNKLLVLLYTGFLTMALVLDIVLLVLTSILLNGLTTWIKQSFADSYLYYSNTWINADLKSAWDAMFVNMQCCGVTGTNNVCSGNAYTVGCWDKYYAPMTGYVWSLFLLFIGSIVIDMVGIVISELTYQRMDDKPKCSSGMCSQFGKFVYSSWKASKGKVIFTVITVIDTMAGLGLIVAGIVTLQSDFVSNSFLSPLFGNLRFYNMYLPELMIGLGATMVTVGALNTGTCSLGHNLLCFKSKLKIIIARVLQITMIVVLIVAFVFWFIMLYGVRDLLEFQLYKEFVGYNHQHDTGYYYTKSWQALFVTYTCCKVKGLEYRIPPVSAGIPEQCLYERTPVNSNLNYLGATIATGSYNEEFCEEKLSDEIYKYQVVVAVLFGIAIFAKVYTLGYLFTKKYQTGDGSSRVPFSVTLRGLKRQVTSQKIQIKQIQLKKMQVALICVLVTGLLVSAGILITGARLRFDNVFGHKDIQQLFSYVYVGGGSLNVWMRALTYYMIGMGCATLLLFGIACFSVASGLPAFYIVTLIGFLLSIAVEIFGICGWIYVRVEIDWNLTNELRSVLLNYYRTDSSDHYLYYGTVNLGFNFLFYEADCCGVDSYSDLNYVSWVTSYFSPSYPRTCHLTTDTVRWYTNRALAIQKNAFDLKGCGTEVRNSIHNYDVTAFVLFALALVLEITAMVLLDRRYKQTVSPDQERGAFSTLVYYVKGKRVNDIHLHGLSARILAFVGITAFLMFAEILLWIGVLMLTFAPGYLNYGFLDNLNTAEEIYNDQYPHLGYLMYGLLICVFVMELVFVILHLVTIFAIRTLRKGFIYMSAVLLVFMIICDILTLSLASLLINKAGYNCDYTFPWTEFCSSNAATLFILMGVFIGFSVVHILILCVLIGLGIRVSKENATSVTVVVPIDELDVLSLSNSDNDLSLGDNVRNVSALNSSSDRQNTDSRRKSVAKPTSHRRPSIAQSTAGRRTSLAQSTAGRRTSVAQPNTDRRSSVTPIADSVGVRSPLSNEDDDIENDDLETTYT
ncbi:uncharacterized protein LOC110442263 isoform X2 [Mizuhopecten yessoensis]|uniref:uncharacterized protein LOC110442263 isoform X2 n=1 Tax=Mizuhopecten yessoensis TaxID=6573 RepID=UPI000B45F47A|nr:uncharacterized protein LOC110442263 isoform X2 [Mizuhopecten yessoensis]